jgi:hypothetical protein
MYDILMVRSIAMMRQTFETKRRVKQKKEKARRCSRDTTFIVTRGEG